MRRRLSVVVLAVLAGVTGMAGIAGVPGVANAATGVTLYASPAGTGDCSSAAAACSLQAAVTEANGDSGDTVVLAGGTYTDVALTLNASMSLIAAPGADPVLWGTSLDADTVPIFVAAGAATISGLTVTNGPYAVGTSYTAQSLTVTGSTLEGNIEGIQSGVPVTVTGTTISANSDAMTVTGSSMTVTNSTITGNTNGIYLQEGASLTMTGSTLSDNKQSGIVGDDQVTLGSSLITDDGLLDCQVGGGEPGSSFVTDAGYNVASDDSCGLGPTSVSGASAAAIGLGALAANGSSGPQTQAIGTGSVAYQLVPVSSGLCPATDERGVPRPGAGTTDCDAGAYELHQAVTLTQTGTATGSVTAGTAFSGQLAVTGATGPVSYVTTSPASPVTVSAAGVISAPATVPAGVYQLTGTDSDTLGDSGNWAFTLTVTAAGPARADLSISAAAPAAVAPSATVTVKLTVANAGPSAAAKTGTALLIPRGWTVASAGGGTVTGKQLITFTDASVAANATITYTVTLTAPATKGTGLLTAAVASTVKDPNIRNNLTLILIRVS
jgi:hypothetical protein